MTLDEIREVLVNGRAFILSETNACPPGCSHPDCATLNRQFDSWCDERARTIAQALAGEEAAPEAVRKVDGGAWCENDRPTGRPGQTWLAGIQFECSSPEQAIATRVWLDAVTRARTPEADASVQRDREAAVRELLTALEDEGLADDETGHTADCAASGNAQCQCHVGAAARARDLYPEVSK